MSAETDLADRSERALGLLFDRHAAAVFRLAFALLRDADEAQDVVQDVFVVAWRKRRSIVLVDGSALPWLLAAARLTALASRRRMGRRRAEAVSDDELHRVPAAVETDDVAAMRHAISALPDADRLLLTLVLIEGRPYAEAAEHLGLTVSAAGKRLQRTRARLQREIRPERTAP